MTTQASIENTDSEDEIKQTINELENKINSLKSIIEPLIKNRSFQLEKKFL